MLAALFIGPSDPATNSGFPPSFAETSSAAARAARTAAAFMSRTKSAPIPYSDCTTEFAPKVFVVAMSDPAR